MPAAYAHAMTMQRGSKRSRTSSSRTTTPGTGSRSGARSTTSGSAWVHFPVGFGGLGVDPALQRIVESRLRSEGIEYAETGWNGFGLFLAAPTIVQHAEPETRARLLRPLFTGEEVWCQLFSEPGAGSDLASLATRAVRDGDEWVVNGQKVWNTLAHMADRGMLVAAHRPGRPQAQGPHLLRARHARGGRRGPPARPDHR